MKGIKMIALHSNGSPNSHTGLRRPPFLASEYSIADMACWPWVNLVSVIGIDLAEFPHVKRWCKAMAERPTVQEAVEGADRVPARFLEQRVKLTDDEWSSTFDENMLTSAKSTI